MLLQFRPDKTLSDVRISLPGSKSISHRYLMLNAISEKPARIVGLSESLDTILLQNAFMDPNKDSHWFEDGATPLRFFMAYAANVGLRCRLDGSPGLRKRTILPLVESLKTAGAEFHFSANEGFPPVDIVRACRKSGHLSIQREASSQFASALLLMAPKFSQKFHLRLGGKANSDAYVRMTLKCMEEFGIMSNWNPESNEIQIDSTHFLPPKELQVEPDWTAASYFYALCACLPESSFNLDGLKISGKQGDEKLQAFYLKLGVETQKLSNGLKISRTGNPSEQPEFDCTDNIDLAPALIATCAFLHLNAKFTGLENLALKESNRIVAITENLKTFGCALTGKNGSWEFNYSSATENNNKHRIRTFNDHRIAMAMSVFALKHNLEIDEPGCVIKSFPGFWNELYKCNFVQN